MAKKIPEQEFCDFQDYLDLDIVYDFEEDTKNNKEEEFREKTKAFWATNPTEQEILKEIDENSERILEEAPLNLLADREFMLKAVKTRGYCLEYASDDLKDDEEVVFEAIQGGDAWGTRFAFAFEYASQRLRSNKEFALQAMQVTGGLALASVCDDLKNDKDVVLMAVKHGEEPSQCDPIEALKYASEEMRADKEVVLASVRQSGWSLAFACEELKADKDVVLVATKNHSWSFTLSAPSLWVDKEFVISLVERVGEHVLPYVDQGLQKDPDVLEAVKRHVPLDEDYGFAYYGLNSILIPATATYVDTYGLLFTPNIRRNIESITVEEGNPVYHSAGNCLIETASKTLVLGCKNSVIPDDGSVEIIGNSAFADCETLKSIHIPAGVTTIMEDAFGSVDYICRNLERITVSPNSKNFYSINDEILVCKKYCDGDCIVYACKNLKNFTFPKEIQTLYCGAFTACKNLESLNVVRENPWLYSVNNCVVYKEISMLALGCKNSIIPNDGSIKSLGPAAFSGVELKNLYIPANWDWDALMDELNGTFPLDGCAVAENIIVADDNAWFHSTNGCLINRNEKHLVCGCKNSTIPDDGSVLSIGHDAFYRCEFTNITIPSPIKSIDDLAFHKCSNLTTVVMSNSVEWVAWEAFYKCDLLSHIFYCGTQSELESKGLKMNCNLTKETTWYCYSEEKPTEDGDYWHYVDGEPTVW